MFTALQQDLRTMKPHRALLLASLIVPQLSVAQTVTSEALAGLPFREIGPVTMSGRVVDLAVVESNPYTFYVASATGGVWKTDNNGVTFRPVFHKEATHSVGAITVHQRDTNIVWVGTGERANRQSSSWGDGVYKSTDGGETWRNMGLRDSHHIGRIAMHPDNPDIVFVAAMGHLWGPNEERGLYMSRNGGDTWNRVLEGDENTGVVDVTIDHVDPNIMYAAKYQRRRRPYGFHGGGPGGGLFKSTDGGETWRELRTGLPDGDVGRIGISIYRGDPRIVVVSVEQGWRYNASTAYNERRAGVYRSEDKGETWEFMSDWNPRPMYASQPLIDPSDDQRIYMQNSFSYSDDGGRNFQRARQSLHGDDRILWVNPNDSRHVIKGDDGGLGISYDRAVTWLYMRHLPLSQFYRVSYDLQKPYRVYGGLQDNGSWSGPSATYRGEGIVFDDWFKTGGGDGFLNLVDTTDNRTLYVESQYLGLSRLDLVSRVRKSIRPDQPRGAIGPRRNWDAWGPGTPEPELANAMAPANWDGPFIISSHNTSTLYAGTNQLWKSVDRGDTWVSLSDLTTGVDRRELPIMGERAHDSTLSLDDGIPYFPTLSAIEESPLRAGWLYVGTDDGNVQLSQDDGATWTNVTSRLPGLPEMTWINGIEASHHDAGTVYIVSNNYRNDDFTNYVYRSTDNGDTWESITSDLPPNRVARTLREDLRNPNVLYLGTELGLFYSNDAGANWVQLNGNLPTVAVNDLVLHPRDNDLILGTHGRGIWILDNVNALQELTSDVMASNTRLFTIEAAEQIRYSNEKGHTGDMIFRGENPAAGAVIDYYLASEQDVDDVSITIHNGSGAQISSVEPLGKAGLNRVAWNLRHANLNVSRGFGGGGGMTGPWVLPGQYTVRLTVGDETLEQPVRVLDDPRIDVDPADRRFWHHTLVTLAKSIEEFAPLADSLRQINRQVADMSDAERQQNRRMIAELEGVAPKAIELRTRMMRLYGAIQGWPGRPTSDQMAQMEYFEEWRVRLMPDVLRALNATM